MTSARLVLPPDRRIMRYNGRRSYCLLLALRHVTSFMPRCTSGQSAIQLSRGWGGGVGGLSRSVPKYTQPAFSASSTTTNFAAPVAIDTRRHFRGTALLFSGWVGSGWRADPCLFCFVLFWDVFPFIISVQPSEIVSENLWKIYNSAFTSSLRIINVGFGLFSLRLKPPPVIVVYTFARNTRRN